MWWQGGIQNLRTLSLHRVLSFRHLISCLCTTIFEIMQRNFYCSKATNDFDAFLLILMYFVCCQVLPYTISSSGEMPEMTEFRWEVASVDHLVQSHAHWFQLYIVPCSKATRAGKSMSKWATAKLLLMQDVSWNFHILVSLLL